MDEKLKDFQKKTVEKVIERFYKKNQKRVLVADEVGLGKTLIAKGVLDEVYKKEKSKDFTAIYLCSNQNVANQNIIKLSSNIKNYASYRLSMLNVQLFKQQKEENNEENEKIIALTPMTSLKLKESKSGIKPERVQIYCTIEGIIENKLKNFNIETEKLKETLKEILKGKARNINWNYEIKEFKNYLNEYEDEYIDEMSKYLYEENIIDEIYSLLEGNIPENNKKLNEKIEKICELLTNTTLDNRRKLEIIKILREAFSNISLKKLNPNLVIMDEFQRFKDLLNSEEKLIKKFFEDENLKILLLSATPYKLYATQEEINESEILGEENYNEYYKEFLNVMRFLFPDEKEYNRFKKVWEEHSKKLNNIKNLTDEEFKEMLETKKNAENEMYKVILRTERTQKLENAMLKKLTANEYDIASFFQINNIIKQMDKKNSMLNFRIDYSKSCPYLLSFMNYKLKREMEEYYKNNPKEFDKIKEENWFKENQVVWLDKEKVDEYKYDDDNPICKTNEKLNYIINDIIFEDKIENLLWIPPTKKYYNLGGAFKEIKNPNKITKTLIFSSWEMVPRMISGLISYEEERKILHNKYTSPRLVFKKDKKGNINKNLLILYYPSKTLSSLFNKIDVLNKFENKRNKENFNEALKEEIYKEFQKKLKQKNIIENKNEKQDSKWNYLVPLLLDDGEYVEKWFENIKEIIDEEQLEKLKQEYESVLEAGENGEIILGKNPASSEEYKEIIANLIIAGPANCAYRIFESIEASIKMAQNFVSLFNTNEAMEIISICYKKEEEKSYWKRVLKYCFDGNLQAVLDEYVYMIQESNCLQNDENKTKVFELLNESMNINRTTTSTIDTLESFGARIKGKDGYENYTIKMKNNFAVPFSQKDSSKDEKVINRKESVRKAFNSPFWPFVLTTTSIGQEGLDFHYYCNRIIHWNLPSNPVDLEQREGRINRFKCLAIRKEIVKESKLKEFSSDVWKEMFEEIENREVENSEGGLVPNWCLSKDKKINIERIIPIYSFSEDENKYQRLKQILALYRMTLGQENQEEILNMIINDTDQDKEKFKELFFNLSPYKKEKKKFRF